MLNIFGIILLNTLLVAFVQTLPQGRIVGGRDAMTSQFPYQVSVRFHGSHFCGGSIISHNYILTAAHCVVFLDNEIYIFRYPEEYSIYAGSVNRLYNGVEIPVVSIIAHEDYKSLKNDIALLKLATPLDFNDKIKAIPLATKKSLEKSSVIISGWGTWKSTQILESPIQLQWAIVSLTEMKQCPEINPYNHNNSLICLRSNERSACYGDSGGPAAVFNELIGICSFGTGRCGGPYPDGYTKVYHYLDWIRKHSVH